MNKVNNMIHMNKLNHIIRRHINSTNKSCVTDNTIIFNKKFRKCKHCKHLNINDHDKCKKFGEYVSTNGKYDFVNGKYEHLFADVCRRDETKCGESAIFYEEMTKYESDAKNLEWLIDNVVMPIGIFGIAVMAFNVIIR